jgi:TolB-like protein/predicted Zn-dependent protease
VTEPSPAVFLSYASQDAQAAKGICEALRASGIEVWFDQSELRGGDVWDQKIRRQIRDCALFVPVISESTQSRVEGYFRLEWRLGDQRTHLMGRARAFIAPVCIDATTESDADVPESFLAAQWFRLPHGQPTPAFVARILELLSSEARTRPEAPSAVPRVTTPGPLAAAAPVRSRFRRRIVPLLAAGTVGLLLIGGTMWYRGVLPTVSERSIAVLPFIDLSEKHDQEYFGEAMAEEILNLLSRVPGLKVIGRSSSFRFGGRQETSQSIGAALGASFLLEGTVQRAADRVRVTAELISSADGVQRWSNTYDRDLHDVLKVQGEISASLVRALQLELKSSSQLLKQGSLHSTEAYDAYLRGYHAHDQYSAAGLDEAVVEFRRALELDPSFVPAAETLAMTLRNQAAFGFVDAQAGFAEARHAAEQALRLDPNSALAHAILGDIAVEHEWNWAAAATQLQRALALSPREPNVLIFASGLPQARGDLAEALRLIELSLDADPFDSGNTVSLGTLYLAMGRNQDAERALRHALEIAPTQPGVHSLVALALLQQGMPDQALAEAQQEPDEPSRLGALAMCHHALKREPESAASTARLEGGSARTSAYLLADVYAYRGQGDTAFRWLDRAYAQKDVQLWTVKGDPLLAPLRSDPRFRAFLRKMNLPE